MGLRMRRAGKEGTLWEGGEYPLDIHFHQNHPTEHPSCRFPKGLVHPNVFDTGHGEGPCLGEW